MNKRTLIIVLLAAVVAAGAVGYFMWNKPHKQVEDVTAIKVTAADLCKEFVDNEALAKQKYLNNVVEVTGVTSETSTNQDGYTLMTLQGEDDNASVQCTMREKGVTIEPGRTVTAKGFFSDNNMFGVNLTDCVIVK
jgi:hypothetical protein